MASQEEIEKEIELLKKKTVVVETALKESEETKTEILRERNKDKEEVKELKNKISSKEADLKLETANLRRSNQTLEKNEERLELLEGDLNIRDLKLGFARFLERLKRMSGSRVPYLTAGMIDSSGNIELQNRTFTKSLFFNHKKGCYLKFPELATGVRKGAVLKGSGLSLYQQGYPLPLVPKKKGDNYVLTGAEIFDDAMSGEFIERMLQGKNAFQDYKGYIIVAILFILGAFAYSIIFGGTETLYVVPDSVQDLTVAGTG